MIDSNVVYYGEDNIHYEVVRKDFARKEPTKKKAVDKSESDKPLTKKTKPRKVVIKVHPDQRVVATAPIDASDEIIHDAMMKRARWIWQSLQAFSKQQDHVLPKRYISGETQFYLGRRYVLKVITDSENEPSVKLSRGKLNVFLQQTHNKIDQKIQAEKVKNMVDKWYQNRAKTVFSARLKALLPKASWVKDVPLYKVLVMQKQWGSCSTKGNLILNPHLVKAPRECIDYVILHELCHIAEYNHSERFWRLMTQVMPNWKEVKAELDGMAELYLNE